MCGASLGAAGTAVPAPADQPVVSTAPAKVSAPAAVPVAAVPAAAVPAPAVPAAPVVAPAPAPAAPGGTAAEIMNRGKLVPDKFAAALAVPKADKPVKIDGTLNEPAWDNAVAIGDFVEGKGQKAQVDTRVLATYDSDNLYLAVICEEPNTDKLVAKATERDGSVWGDDCVEFYLDPSNAKQPKNYFAFFANCKNVVYDRAGDPNWSGQWTSATTVIPDKAWIVEVAIPFKTMNVSSAGAGHKLGLMVQRDRKAGLEKPQALFLIPCNKEAKNTAVYPVLQLK